LNSELKNPDSIICPDGFLPLTLLLLSFILNLIWQLSAISSQRSGFQYTIQRQDELVSQSHKVQAGFQKLMNDLLDLAQTDEDAKAIAKKHGIARNANAR